MKSPLTTFSLLKLLYLEGNSACLSETKDNKEKKIVFETNKQWT